MASLGGHPIERATEALRFFREFMASPPDDLAAVAAIGTALDGAQGVAFWAFHAGPPDEGERALAPLRRFGPPIADTIGPLPYTAVQSMMDQRSPYGRGRYWKSSLLREIGDEQIEVIVDHVWRRPVPLTGASFVGLLHGAKCRVARTDTAYVHRDARYDMLIAANWTDPADAERGVAWARELFEALRPHLPDMVYMNVLDQDDGGQRVRQAYGENYARLAELKAAYDPTNFFRMNHNFRPTDRR